MEHIVKPGTYIPETNFTYPENPSEPLFNPKIIRNIDIENNFPFLDKSFKGRIRNFLIYTGIFLLVFPLNKIRYGLKVTGKKNLRKNRKHFKNGAITVANHVYRWDYLAVLYAVKFRRMWFPARAANIQGSDSNFILGAGGIPIPETLGAARHFNEAFDTLHKKKKWIHIFPESCRWEFYEPIRPFFKGSFKMAYRYKVPVIPMVFSYREPKGIYKLFKVKHPLITLSIGNPIFQDSKEYEGLSKNEIIEKMCLDTHQQMVEMAGIEQNCWPPIAE